VEKLLGITDQITERATVIRVLMMELNRIARTWSGSVPTGLELARSR
jgi:NADH-quinone oxidoreductase subunit D